jgi:hypothetical protein
MPSTTAVLDACQARNDSGSLTPSFTGLVTIFNIHVMDTDPENPNRAARVYVDPIGEPIAGGLVKAPKISYGKANRMYC